MMTQLITVNPTVDTAAYAAGDLIGGKLSLTNALGARASGKLSGLVLIDQAKQNAAIDLIFFGANPTNTTFTDNAALDIHDTDNLAVIGGAKILAADYFAQANNSFAVLKDINLPLYGASSIYACLVSRGTPTYAAGTDLRLKLFFEV